jgi:uncharacterized membrane protein
LKVTDENYSTVLVDATNAFSITVDMFNKWSSKLEIEESQELHDNWRLSDFKNTRVGLVHRFNYAEMLNIKIDPAVQKQWDLTIAKYDKFKQLLVDMKTAATQLSRIDESASSILNKSQEFINEAVMEVANSKETI